MHQFQSPSELTRYNTWVKTHPQGSLWQSLEWKTYQEALGREVRVYVQESDNAIRASALVVIDKTAFGLRTWDIPRGPLGDAGGLLGHMIEQAKSERCMALYFSPQQEISAIPYALAASSRHEQPRATRVIDLTLSEDAILAQMKQKGRYNIRVAEKHGVRVGQSTDIEAFASLAQDTARRDRFQAPHASRYRTFLSSLPGTFLLLAYAPAPTPSPIGGGGQGERAIAGLLGAIWNGTGVYYYGASDYAYRNLMAPYLLQWEAMRYCKTQGCHTYDLLGISPQSNEELGIRDSWSGITRFKEQFGGTVVEYPPEQQIMLKPWTNRLLQLKRKFL